MTIENAAETAMWIVMEGGCQGIFHAISEEDLQRILVHPATMIASDGEMPTFGQAVPHPRSYGTFVRVLGLYVREKKLLTLEDAVQKMSSFPAQRLGLADRGVLRTGLKADLAIFDPARVRRHRHLREAAQLRGRRLDGDRQRPDRLRERGDDPGASGTRALRPGDRGEAIDSRLSNAKIAKNAKNCQNCRTSHFSESGRTSRFEIDPRKRGYLYSWHFCHFWHFWHLMNQSSRLAAVQPPVIPIVGRWTAETPGTVSLGQGIVWYGPPPEVMAAVRAFGSALADHRYGPVEGLPDLVSAVETKLARENGIVVRPASRVLVTAGGNQAFVNAVLAVTDPGDEVILPAPYYFNHEMAIVIAGAVPVGVATDREYQLDVDAIAAAITARTRAVVTVSPNNPTGAVYPEEPLRAVNALCRDRGIFHIHDEAYEYFTYAPARHFSPGSLPDAAGHTLSLYSLSKAYGMASWRVGYMVVPEVLAEAINKIQDTLLICPPAASQRAALAALAVGAPIPAATWRSWIRCDTRSSRR